MGASLRAPAPTPSLPTHFLPPTRARPPQVLSKCMGNDQYDRSDHKWLQVEVNLQAPAPTANGSRASHATTAIGAPVAGGGKL